MLGDTLALIAAEKAGIMKPGVPVAIGAQPAEVLDVLLARAERVGAPVTLRDRDWRVSSHRYSDVRGELLLPKPSLPGAFQFDNAGIAIAALRASGLPMAVAAASRPRNGRRGCNACMAVSPRCCHRIGSFGWTAATILAPALCLASIWRAWHDRQAASDRRHEGQQGRGGVLAAAAAIRDDAMGRGGAGTAFERCPSRRSSPRRAVLPVRVRVSAMRYAPCRATGRRRVC